MRIIPLCVRLCAECWDFISPTSGHLYTVAGPVEHKEIYTFTRSSNQTKIGHLAGTKIQEYFSPSFYSVLEIFCQSVYDTSVTRGNVLFQEVFKEILQFWKVLNSINDKSEYFPVSLFLCFLCVCVYFSKCFVS